MENSDFWSMWGALSTTASAIATFLAVFVALWQSKIAVKKRLKVELKQAFTLPEKVNYIQLDISNHSNREIIVDSWTWEYRDKSTVVFSNNVCRFISMNDFVELPFILKPECNLKILCPKKQVSLCLREAVMNKTASLSDELKIYVSDTTGDKYYCKSRLKVSAYVPQQSKE